MTRDDAVRHAMEQAADLSVVAVLAGADAAAQQARLDLLDELAETFKKHGEDRAYHHVRAVAHDHNLHLTSCSVGKRIGEPEHTSSMKRLTEGS
jgi:hypothetical protein